MDSDKLIAGIVAAVIVTFAWMILKPLFAEIPIVGTVLRGAGWQAGREIVEGAAPSQRNDLCANAGEHWKSVESSAKREAYIDHLDRFPHCDFATIAKMKIRDLDTGHEAQRATGTIQRRAEEEAARHRAEEERQRVEEQAARARELEARRRGEKDARKAIERAAAREKIERERAERAAVEERRRQLIEVVRRDRCKAVSVCPAGKIFSLTHGECIPIQHYGGVIPGSQDDTRFDPRTGRWLPNC